MASHYCCIYLFFISLITVFISPLALRSLKVLDLVRWPIASFMALFLSSIKCDIFSSSIRNHWGYAFGFFGRISLAVDSIAVFSFSYDSTSELPVASNCSLTDLQNCNRVSSSFSLEASSRSSCCRLLRLIFFSRAKILSLQLIPKWSLYRIGLCNLHLKTLISSSFLWWNHQFDEAISIWGDSKSNTAFSGRRL